MCLSIWIEASPTDRELLVAAGESALQFGLRVDVGHPSRWSWARSSPIRATVSEDGTCACGLLSDSADWGADTWAMRQEIVEPLACTLEWLSEHGPRRLVIEALWAGDRAVDECRVEPSELGRIVGTTGLGTKRRYIVERGAA